jgi:ribosome-binding protein aMBF1 (putative translation factor)
MTEQCEICGKYVTRRTWQVIDETWFNVCGECKSERTEW